MFSTPISMFSGLSTYSTVDPNATAFLSATGITDPTISSAINTLVISLKANNLWDKLNAIYPYVGGTATTHKYNLKNPADTDAAFRLAFVGNLEHTSQGVKNLRTTATYANTFVNFAALGYTNLTLGMYINQGVAADNSCYDSGVYDASNNSDVGLLASCGLNNTFYFRAGGSAWITISESNQLGFYMGTSNGTNALLYKNGVFRTSGTGFNMPNRVFTLFSNNTNGVFGQDPSSRRQAFYFIGNSYMSATDASNLNTIIQTFQTSLGRQV